ncbi:hypothetical protein BDZ94DRAFT_1314337 [Collybia nuda]|uniref:Uncharacterized protein n=1 Tax=Collybia nuda TaxID=64659 RepID=A0A9P5XUJ3_9AGAR|nr:hypothetical protein BDZ94DRAFT_1314337 [Collybia nuda]
MSSVGFILATVYETTKLVMLGMWVHAMFIKYQDFPLQERFSLLDVLLLSPTMISAGADRFTPVITDGIVIWRAFTLLQRRRWLVIFPSFLLIGSAASYVTFIISAANDVHNVHSYVRSIAGVGVGLSLGTNTIGTALIGYAYWQVVSSLSLPINPMTCAHRLHKRDMAKDVERSTPTPAEKILALLVDSGLVYCVIQAAYFMQGFFEHNMSAVEKHVHTVFKNIYYELSAMYPTMVLALVNNHRDLETMRLMNAFIPPTIITAESNYTTIRFVVPNSITTTRAANSTVESVDRI